MNLNDGSQIAVALEGYKISDTKVNSVNSTITYDGFVDRSGAWYIIAQTAANDTDSTFRYARGDSGYITAWAARESNTYDYFFNIFN